MSIRPKIVDRSKDKTVQLHMRVQNDEDFAITGRIILEIVSPEKITIRIIEKTVRLGGKEIIDKYFKHSTAELQKGRFVVNGKFVVHNQEFISETASTDFFDVAS